MEDFGDELEQIKREIVESRALTIKTNNLVNALSADVSSIAKRQQNTEQRFKWASATTYVVGVAVFLILGKIVVDARVEAERAKTKDQRDELAKLEKELNLSKTREEARARAERKAAEYYGLILLNKRREVIEQFDDVQKLDLSKTEQALFSRAVERAKSELSLIAYQEGLDHVRAERWHEAEQSLSESLRYNPSSSHAPNAKLKLAQAFRILGRQREAVPILMSLSESSPDKEVMDDATYLLAQTQVDLQAYNDAKNTLRAFIRRFPTSARLNDARMQLAELRLHH